MEIVSQKVALNRLHSGVWSAITGYPDMGYHWFMKDGARYFDDCTSDTYLSVWIGTQVFVEAPNYVRDIE